MAYLAYWRDRCGNLSISHHTHTHNTAGKRQAALWHMTKQTGLIQQDADKSDNFTSQSLMKTLPGALSIHVRYSTAGSASGHRDVHGEFAMEGAAIAHNGNITNAEALRRELIERVRFFKVPLIRNVSFISWRSLQRNIPNVWKTPSQGRRCLFHCCHDEKQTHRRA